MQEQPPLQEPQPSQPQETPIQDSAPAEPQTPNPFAATPPIATEAGPITKSKLPLRLIIIIAAAVVVLVGGSVAAYNLWYQNPSKVVADAAINAITKTKTVSATLTGTIAGDDSSNNTTVKLDSTIKANSSASELDLKATIDGGGSSTPLNASVIAMNSGTAYIQLNNVNDLLTSLLGQGTDLSVYQGLIDDVNGKWIKISNGDLDSVSDTVSQYQACYGQIETSFTSNKTWGQEIATLYKKDLFIDSTKVGSKTINGVGSLGYRLSIDDNKLETFIKGLQDTQFGKKLTSCDSSMSFDTLANDVKQDNTAPTAALTVWASRFGHQLTEVDLNPTGSSQNKTTLMLQPTFNKTVNITEPTDATTVTQLETNLESAFTGLSE